MQIRYAAVTTCLFVCGVTYAAQRTITVKAGDNDRKIARKLGISEVSLREANPDVRWTRLQIGQALALPEGAEESAEPIKKTKAHKTSKAH
ncbi:MAG: LysM peptidoglycan-binding domain-containing protein, partial [Fimbriimonas ginsengisoli]|nr:LysM peptidoglycan-binding domain-containing protein [Fimbriimonas ginsengisoli]